MRPTDIRQSGDYSWTVGKPIKVSDYAKASWAVPKIPRASAMAPELGTVRIRRSIESMNSVQRAIDRIGATSRMLGLGTAESTTAKMMRGGTFGLADKPAFKAMSSGLTARYQDATVRRVTGLSLGAQLPESAAEKVTSQTGRTMDLEGKVTKRRLDQFAGVPFAATEAAVEKLARAYAPRISVGGANLSQLFGATAKVTGGIDAAAVGKWEGLAHRPFVAHQNSISRILESYARPQSSLADAMKGLIPSFDAALDGLGRRAKIPIFDFGNIATVANFSPFGGLAKTMKLGPFSFDSEFWRSPWIGSSIFDGARVIQRSIDQLTIIEFVGTWAGRAIWFVIQGLPASAARILLPHDEDRVRQAVIDGLEQVVDSTDVLADISAALRQFDFIEEQQMEWLQEGLRDVAEKKWGAASLPLTVAFEGVVFNGAIEAEEWIEEGGKEAAMEKLLKAIELDPDLRNFIIRLLYGGRGNSFRHGRPKYPAREQSLLLLIAIAGWIDMMAGSGSADRLLAELQEPLVSRLEVEVQAPALELQPVPS